MVANFHLPPQGFGPGSQPAGEDGELEYLALPSGMRTYSPHLPEVGDRAAAAPALELLGEIARACARAAAGDPSEFDLAALSPAGRALVAETLGQGEVSMRIRGIPAVAVQEAVFAGVWVLKGAGVDRICVAPCPGLASLRAHHPVRPALGARAPTGPGVMNAAALLAELLDKSAAYAPGVPAHAINLTLLPHTEDDLAWLDAALGEGAVTILSRGYGNCRITATAQPHVWRVRYFNSMDTLILDTFEVGGLPEVALAAPEDLAESGARIVEVLEAIG